MKKYWLIWSMEHGAFWGPERLGYRRCADGAGRYSFAEMQEIIAQANLVAPCEIPVASQELFSDPNISEEEKNLVVRLGNAALRGGI